MNVSILLLLLAGVVSCEVEDEFQQPKAAPDRTLTPVVLVPGDGGSQLHATLNKPTAKWFCKKKAKKYLLWLNLESVVYPSVECFADNMLMKFDPYTNTSRDNDGVHIEVDNFGDTAPVEWISNVHFSKTNYFNKLTEYLVNNHGYIRNFNIRGAPYDFRRGPNEHTQFYNQLTKLIEDTYEKTGKRKVVLVGHSLGCMHSLHLLQNKTTEWKAKYISKFVAAAGPFGGAVSSLLAVTSGYNSGLFWDNPFWFREAQRSWLSTYFLLPSSAIFPKSQILVHSPSGETYSSNDYKQLFSRLGLANAYEHRQRILRQIKEVAPPGVETLCIHGVGVNTLDSMKWNKESDFPDKQPTKMYGDGDGTVNRVSLEMCKVWRNMQRQPIHMVQLNNAEHLQLLQDDRFLSNLGNLLTGK